MSIVVSAWAIQASRAKLGRSRIVVSGRERMARSSAFRVLAYVVVESSSFGTDYGTMEE
jgi:hypothetical protein